MTRSRFRVCHYLVIPYLLRNDAGHSTFPPNLEGPCGYRAVRVQGLLKSQAGFHLPTLGPRLVPYSYMGHSLD